MKQFSEIKDFCQSLGFLDCSVTKSRFLEDEAPRLKNWLKENRHGEMKYMENHFEKRLDPAKLHEGTKSVLVFLHNYYPSKEMSESGLKISKYAYGKDYHKVIKKKMKQIQLKMSEVYGEHHSRAFVDSAPILEKAWAKMAGLGWVGKNTNLIHPEKGSFFFISIILTDLQFEDEGKLLPDLCKGCKRCITSCPTGALDQAYFIDGSKCISYLTIELKESIPESFKGKLENWIFGCDICQDVCPWNRYSSPHHESLFEPKSILFEMMKEDWQTLEEEQFAELFFGTAVKRTGYKGLKRNIIFQNNDDPSNRIN